MLGVEKNWTYDPFRFNQSFRSSPHATPGSKVLYFLFQMDWPEFPQRQGSSGANIKWIRRAWLSQLGVKCSIWKDSSTIASPLANPSSPALPSPFPGTQRMPRDPRLGSGHPGPALSLCRCAAATPRPSASNRPRRLTSSEGWGAGGAGSMEEHGITRSEWLSVAVVGRLWRTSIFWDGNCLFWEGRRLNLPKKKKAATHVLWCSCDYT